MIGRARSIRAVFAVHAFAVLRAHDVSLKALAVLLLTMTVFAVAALEVLVFLVHTRLKRLDVPLQDVDDGSLAVLLEVVVVSASIRLTEVLVALAFWAAGAFVPEALAVQLETLGVLALALDTLWLAFLLHLVGLVSLVLCLPHDSFGQLVDLLIVFCVGQSLVCLRGGFTWRWHASSRVVLATEKLRLLVRKGLDNVLGIHQTVGQVLLVA